MGYMMNIENHPFFPEIFVFFDQNEDGIVDFEEFVKGMDVMERGSFV